MRPSKRSSALGLVIALVAGTSACGEATAPDSSAEVDQVQISHCEFTEVPRTIPSGDARSDRIRPSRQNPCYWEYKGEPLLLLGASNEDNIFNHPDLPPAGLEAHLDLLVESGGNYIRNTMSSRDEGNLWPFHRLADESYDLDRWNEAYWDRLSALLDAALEREIIVQLEIWDRFDFSQEPWEKNPFNPANTRDYTAEASGLPERVDSHPAQKENPFFRSIPDLDDLPRVLEYQTALVDRLLDITLEYPNVLYTISNETNESPSWSRHWAQRVQARARERNIGVEITEMWDPWDLSDPMHRATFDHPELYSYVDISQNNHQMSQDHWDRAQRALSRRVADPPRPANSVKIYGGERHGGGTEEGTRKLWRNIFGGLASSRFHRPSNPLNPSGIGLNPLAQRQLGSARMFTDSMNVFRAAPRLDLLSDRDSDEAYAMADQGVEYAVYFPDGGSVTLDLVGASGPMAPRWLEIMTGKWTTGSTLQGGAAVSLSPPGPGPWAVLIQRTQEVNR